jgi:uncharacterized protein (TIGR00251 family)
MAESVRLQLRVSPGASRAGIVGRYGDAWKVRVDARPEAGRANDAVVRLVAELLELPRRDVAIVSGHTNRDKIVTVAGIGPDEAERRLASASRAAGRESA